MRRKTKGFSYWAGLGPCSIFAARLHVPEINRAPEESCLMWLAKFPKD